jgi:cytokinin dehydrogenase
MINRRHFLRGAGTAALVIGFEPVSRVWLGTAAATETPAFAHVPVLDGTLTFALADRQADSVDEGRMITQVPAAVLRPGSVRDIQRMVTFCRAHGIKVATRGQGHTTDGQGLTDGLLIENRSLATIHSIGPDGADVDAGVLWRELAEAAAPHGLTPPLFTTYTGLSIAGTLSVGGFPAQNNLGLQIDHVHELQVVTGTGELVTCSPVKHRDLFEVMLGGLGQCGIIVRAIIDLVPSRQSARVHQLYYPITDVARMFADLRTLLDRGEFAGVYTLIFAPGPQLVFQLNALSLYDAGSPPDSTTLLRGLSVPASAATMADSSYLDWVKRYDPVIESWRQHYQWDDLIKPWYDVILPGSQIEPYVSAVLPSLTPADFGPPTGIGFLFPQRRAKLTREFFRLPPPDGGEWVFLFDILTSSAKPGPDRAYVEAVNARNRRLFDQAHALGATRYPIGTLDFTRADWRAQYGDKWAKLVWLKQCHDPGRILTPGPGIF